jgi:hypothetical protein
MIVTSEVLQCLANFGFSLSRENVLPILLVAGLCTT